MEYKRFVRTVGITVVFLLVVLFFILIRVSENDKESVLNFTYGACDTRFDTTNESQLGIKEIRWLSNNTFFVKAHERFNCVEEILAGDVEIENNIVRLIYKSPICSHYHGCADCHCVRSLLFTYEGIEKGDYYFEIERIR